MSATATATVTPSQTTAYYGARKPVREGPCAEDKDKIDILAGGYKLKFTTDKYIPTDDECKILARLTWAYRSKDPDCIDKRQKDVIRYVFEDKTQSVHMENFAFIAINADLDDAKSAKMKDAPNICRAVLYSLYKNLGEDNARKFSDYYVAKKHHKNFWEMGKDIQAGYRDLPANSAQKEQYGRLMEILQIPR